MSNHHVTRPAKTLLAIVSGPKTECEAYIDRQPEERRVEFTVLTEDEYRRSMRADTVGELQVAELKRMLNLDR